jgi:hypothetical protein
MTREDILNTKNNDLDELIGKYVMGWSLDEFCNGDLKWCDDKSCKCSQFEFNPSEDMNLAWMIFQKAMTWKFSRRKRFFDELQLLTTTKSGAIVAWPDVLCVLKNKMPKSICKAAIIVELNLDRNNFIVNPL